MKRIFASLVIVLGLLGAAAPAGAVDADQVKREVTNALDYIESSFAGVLTYDGVFVVPEGDGFRVTITTLQVGSPADWYLDASGFTYRLIPLDEDRYRVEDLRYPATLPVKGPTGQIATVTLQSQSATGIFSKRLQGFTDTDARYDGIVFQGVTGTTVRIGHVELKAESKGTSPESIDQDARWAMSDIAVTSGGVPALEVAGIDVTQNVRNLNMASYVGAIRDLQSSLVQMRQIETSPEQQAPAVLQQMQRLFRVYPDMTFDMRVHGLEIAGPGGGKALGFSEAGLNFGNDPPAGGLISYFGGISVSDLDLGAFVSPGPIASLLPKALSIQLRLEDVPGKEMLETMMTAFAAEGASQRPDKTVASVAPALQQILTNAKTVLRLTDSFVQTGVSRTEMSGFVQADLSTAKGAVGELDLTFTGFDALMATVKQAMGESTSKKMLAGLQLLGLFAKRTTAADGTVVDQYKLSLSPAGTVLLNDKDVSGLVGAMK